MGLIKRLLGGDTGRPPKPDAEHHSERVGYTQVTLELEYHNGDTETVECFGYHTEGNTIRLKVDPTVRAHMSLSGAYVDMRTQTIPCEYLARPPTKVDSEEVEWELTYDVEWEWDYKRGRFDEKEWRENVTNTDLTRIDDE